jgi:hypothetical protein
MPKSCYYAPWAQQQPGDNGNGCAAASTEERLQSKPLFLAQPPAWAESPMRRCQPSSLTGSGAIEAIRCGASVRAKWMPKPSAQVRSAPAGALTTSAHSQAMRIITLMPSRSTHEATRQPAMCHARLQVRR